MELVNRIDPIELVQSELIKSGLVQLELVQKIWFKNRVSMTGPIGTDSIGTGQNDWSNWNWFYWNWFKNRDWSGWLVQSVEMFVLCNLYNCMFYLQLNILSGSRKFQFWNQFNDSIRFEFLNHFCIFSNALFWLVKI